MCREIATYAAALLPAIFNIFNQWGLTTDQQRILLGLSHEQTLCSWRSHPGDAELSQAMLGRASYILGIYKALQILLPDQKLANHWL